MLDYQRGICQRRPSVFFLVFSLLFIIGGCGRKAVHNDLPPIDAVPVWFKMDQRFSPKNSKDELYPHPFFDLAPFVSVSERSFNFYPLTPEGSKAIYDLDLISGKKFMREELCSQKDVWEKYKKKIEYPPFTEGIVPRLLDITGLPQRVLVFGMEKFYKTLKADNIRSFRVRVVGGVVLQYCSFYPCNNDLRRWLSRPILLAVDLEDPGVHDIFDIGDLKKKYDWEYLEAYMQNAYGRTIVGSGEGALEFPAYRLLKPLSAPKALGFVLKRGHIFSFDELKSLRQQCHRLYDYLWNSSEKIHYYQANPKKRSQLNPTASQKLEDLKKGVVSSEILEKEAVGVESLDFKKLFLDFEKKYRTDYNLCIKYVPAANITENPQRFWFFSYIQAFFELDALGHIYDCAKASWIPNPLDSEGKRAFNFSAKLQNCGQGQLERGIEKAPGYLQGAYQSNLEHIRFLEYDNDRAGTHQKIYSWIYYNGKNLSCVDEAEQKVAAHRKIKRESFPDDVRWKKFFVEERDGLFIRNKIPTKTP